MSRQLTLGLLLVLAPCAGARAQMTVLPQNLVDLSERSATILSGRVVAVRDGRRPEDGIPIRTVTLRVRDVVKAADPGQSPARVRQRRLYTFSQFNSPSLRYSDTRMPDYRVGEEVLLFLAATSRLKLTAPMGIQQGKFTLTTVGRGRRASVLAENSLQNANLSAAGTDPGGPGIRAARAAASRLEAGGVRLTPWERQVLTRTEYGPLEYAPFLRLVRKLAAPRRRA